ncbi:MAG: heavy metal translocating P-type ATPase [Clostridia bacterium]|nr:heavy metal translocating P-type ATPase [Clostridia bacterium]
MKKLRYTVKGMSCAACVAHVERAAAKVVGEDARAVNLLTNSLTVTLDDNTDERKIFAALRASLKAAGYDLADEERGTGVANQETKRASRRLVASLILTLILMYVAMGEMIGLPSPAIFERNPLLFALVQLVLTVPVILLNFRFFRGGFSALLHRAPNMDSLIAIGASASLLWGLVAIGAMATAWHTGDAETLHRYHHNLYFESAAMILTLVSLGKTLEGRAKAKAADAVGKLASMMPSVATAERDGSLIELPLSEVTVGEILIVREGETIPADGIVVEGFGAVDESAISGESIPVDKELGATVTGVCTLVSGHLKIKVTRVGEDTALSRILSLIEDASATKAPIARIADRVSAIFVPAVLGISLLTAALWLLLTHDLTRALECGISVLVISCPCALGLATPTAVTVGISRGATLGILFRSAESLEHLGSVDLLLTDKTGTLTEGRPILTDLIPTDGISEEELLRLCASAETPSTHPLAGAILRAAEEKNLRLAPAERYTSFGGKGISATVDGALCLVGTEQLLREQAVSLPPALSSALTSLIEQGKTAVCVALDGKAIGVLALADEPRTDSADAMCALNQLGVTPVMLTGDHERAARRIADAVGIAPEHVHARLLPEEKEALIRQYNTSGRCAMVGDGINDAPALAAADVGIAIGAGTEVAVDSADVVLTGSNLSDAVTAIKLSRATMRVIKQNLFWALVYNAVCIPVAAGALYPALGITLTPMIGSAAMSISSLCVVLNSLRLRRVSLNRPPRKKSNKENQTMFGKAKTKTITFGVEGMMCNNCKAHVEKALLATKGVTSAEADLAAKAVTVTVKESVSEDTLKSAVTAAGYKVI